MAVLGNKALAEHLSDKLMIPLDAAQQWVEVVFQVINDRIKDGDVTVVEDFGTFHPKGYGKPKNPFFTPNIALLTKLRDAPLMTHTTPVRTPRIVPPVREEDRVIIDRWVASRQLRSSSKVSAISLYRDGGLVNLRPIRLGSEESCLSAKTALFSLARYSNVPLLKFGLTPRNTLDLHDKPCLRKEVVAYAERAEASYLKRAETMRNRPGFKPIPFMESRFWNGIVHYGNDFFNWTITEHLRPVGSNPFDGIVRLSRPSNHRIMMRSYYRQLVNYKLMTLRQKCIVYLLGNGLRLSEVARVNLNNLSLSTKFRDNQREIVANLTIVGKGGKTRVVRIFGWTMKTIDDWTQSRDRKPATSPWLFPGKKTHLVKRQIEKEFEYVRKLAFRHPDDQHKIYAVVPHGLRHYYITIMRDMEVSDRATMNQAGHSHHSMMYRYDHPDETKLQDEVIRKVRTEDFFGC